MANVQMRYANYGPRWRHTCVCKYIVCTFTDWTPLIQGNLVHCIVLLPVNTPPIGEDEDPRASVRTSHGLV